MNRVLCSTGAIITRRNGRDYGLLREIVPRLDCDGLEFMMYESWHDRTDALKAVLSEFDVPVFHMTKQIGQWISEGNMADAEVMFREDCELAKTFGSELLVLHLWSGRASDQHIEWNIAAYPLLRRIAEEYGLLLTSCFVKGVFTFSWQPVQTSSIKCIKKTSQAKYRQRTIALAAFLL